VLSTISPCGVAPPVSDDWAPIGGTAGPDRTSAATSASDDGAAAGRTSRREAARHLRCAGRDVGIALDPRRGSRLAVRRAGPDRVAWHDRQ
jgi:hypothetical protein